MFYFIGKCYRHLLFAFPFISFGTFQMIKNNVRKVVLVLRLKIAISKGVDVALNGRYRAFYEERNETALCNPAMKMEMLLIKFS